MAALRLVVKLAMGLALAAEAQAGTNIAGDMSSMSSRVAAAKPAESNPGSTGPDGATAKSPVTGQERQGRQETETQLGVRIDCLQNFNVDKGAAQDCLSVSGVQLRFQQELASETKGRLIIDPFGTPDQARANSPLRTGIPTTNDTALGVINDFGIRWLARPHLEVGLESYSGATELLGVSGLAFANTLADPAWKQIAATLSYGLKVPIPMAVTFAAGNGEGETIHNRQPQQFFGFRLEAQLIDSLLAYVGGSMNGNDGGSEQAQYLAKKWKTSCVNALVAPEASLGHSTQRLAAGVVLEGGKFGAEGLKLGIGWQRNSAADLDKKQASQPTLADMSAAGCQVDPAYFFTEDPTGMSANNVKHIIYNISLNYKIFGPYFISADYATRSIDSGSVNAFHGCHRFQGRICVDQDENGINRLVQDALTVGGGVSLATGLKFTVEYFKSFYDKQYALMYEQGQNGNISSSMEIINGRISYNWN